MKKAFLFIFLNCAIALSFGQTHEIGASIGVSNFIGDIGRTNYLYPNALGGGLVYKHNLNPRVALTAHYNYINIKANDADSSNPLREARGIKFSNSLHEIAIGTEVSYFNLNINDSRIAYTPYILARVALFNYKKPQALNGNILTTKPTYSYTLPLGVGFKGRIVENVAFAIETGVRFTFVDDIDFSTPKIEGLEYHGQGNDHYIFTGLSVTYTFGRTPCFSNPED